MRLDQHTEELRPVRQSFCRSLLSAPHWKCLLLTMMIAGCLGAILWCRITVVKRIMVRLYDTPRPTTKSQSRQTSPCEDGYIYIPTAFVVMLYLVYLVECWHCHTRLELRHQVDTGTVYARVEAMRAAMPVLWWRALCYHYVRRTRQVTRYRNGDAFTSTQVYYERINSYSASAAFNHVTSGIVDVSQKVVELDKYPAVKVQITKGFSFVNQEAEEEFEEQRTNFFYQHERRDDYMETREGLELLNVNCMDNMMTFADPEHLPWYVSHVVFWIASSLLLSWPLRVWVNYKTATIHFHVHKLFGSNYSDDMPLGLMTRCTTMESRELEFKIRNNYSIVPSYSEAVLMDVCNSSTVNPTSQDVHFTGGRSVAEMPSASSHTGASEFDQLLDHRHKGSKNSCGRSILAVYQQYGAAKSTRQTSTCDSPENSRVLIIANPAVANARLVRLSESETQVRRSSLSETASALPDHITPNPSIRQLAKQFGLRTHRKLKRLISSQHLSNTEFSYGRPSGSYSENDIVHSNVICATWRRSSINASLPLLHSDTDISSSTACYIPPHNTDTETASLTADSSLTSHIPADSPLTSHHSVDSPLTSHHSVDSPLTSHNSVDSPLTSHHSVDSPLTSHHSVDSPLTYRLQAQSPLTDHIPANSSLKAHHSVDSSSTLDSTASASLGNESSQDTDITLVCDHRFTNSQAETVQMTSDESELGADVSHVNSYQNYTSINAINSRVLPIVEPATSIADPTRTTATVDPPPPYEDALYMPRFLTESRPWRNPTYTRLSSNTVPSHSRVNVPETRYTTTTRVTPAARYTGVPIESDESTEQYQWRCLETSL